VPSKIDPVGKVFCRLTVAEVISRDSKHVRVRCICSCGKETEVIYNNLIKGNTRSCGCFKSSVKYAPNTGMLYVNGKPSKYLAKNGYQTTSRFGKSWYVHRLVWKMFYGYEVPTGMDIDHINRVRSDNRIANLRVVTRKENLANTCRNKGDKHEQV
jgi:hypothetical protein